MLTTIQSIHFDADIKLIKMIEEKIKNLEHYCSNLSPLKAEVILKLENTRTASTRKVVEVLLSLSGLPLMVKASARRFEEAFKLAYAQLKAMILKHKNKIQTKH